MEFARDDKKQRVQLAFTGEETASESVGHTDYSDENYSGKQAEELRKREKKKKEREKETKRRRRKTGGEGKRRENRKRGSAARWMRREGEETATRHFSVGADK